MEAEPKTTPAMMVVGVVVVVMVDATVPVAPGKLDADALTRDRLDGDDASELWMTPLSGWPRTATRGWETG